MLRFISKENCSNCETIKEQLIESNIDFEILQFESLGKELQKELRQSAIKAGVMSFPLMIDEGFNFKNLEQILNENKLYIIKRDGSRKEFDKNRITRAVTSAMFDACVEDEELADNIAYYVALNVKAHKLNKNLNVEEIQDMVENFLMVSEYPNVAKKYILYRAEREKIRVKSTVKKEGLLTDEFISKYKHLPNPMGQLGSFVYYRTYSRWLPEENRREYWYETVRRAVEYNCSLAPTSRKEAERLYDNIFNLRQFLSGRTFWIGGTEASKSYAMANFNCAGIVIDEFEAFKDLFYALMVGTGVGFRIIKSDVAKMSPTRKDIELINKEYVGKSKKDRVDSTSLLFNNNTVKIVVGDSKEGWTQALNFYFKIITEKEYINIKTIIIDYDNVRPKGEELKKFGGTASGHKSLKNMFNKIHYTIINTPTNKIRPIDAMDIANIIGENVVVGGVRRTAEITLFDSDDEEVITSKNSMYENVDGKWIPNEKILHRRMSNNSIMYYEKPSREQLHWHVETMRFTGEPAFYVAENALKRRSDFAIPNPCGEILLQSKQLCNLTTVNLMAFVKDGKLDIDALCEAQEMSARAGYRMTCVELEIHKWHVNQRKDRLIGCSLTGWQDMVNATNMSMETQAKVLKVLRNSAHKASEDLAKEIGSNAPLLSTTIKPEGTLSLLPTVSSGLHYSHSPYFIRRVRINSQDALVKVCEELGYPIHAEVGQDIKTCDTKVIEFPVIAPQGKTKYDVSAIEQLETYKMFMENYVDHNASITVHVREHEWAAVEQWLWDNWDCVVGISFLSLDDSYYPLLPYEACSKEEYDKRINSMKPFNPNLIRKYEDKETEFDVGSDAECSSGACGVR